MRHHIEEFDCIICIVIGISIFVIMNNRHDWSWLLNLLPFTEVEGRLDEILVDDFESEL